MEQLGLLRRGRHRAGGQEQRRLHGKAHARPRLGVRGGGHPLVRPRRRGLAVHALRRHLPGRVRPLRARGQPLPLRSRRQGLWPAGGLCARPGPQVRHPHHARRAPQGRLRPLPHQGHEPDLPRHRPPQRQLLVEHRHVRRGLHAPGRAGILRLHIRALRAVGRGLRQGGRHLLPLPRRRDRAGAQCYRALRPRHRAVALLRPRPARQGRPPGPLRQPLAHHRRLLGRLERPVPRL